MAIKREVPEVNAGSMADIAFLLLIFFLVTTTIETDEGLNRKLPIATDESRIKERNLFRVSINANNELFVEEELLELNELRNKTIAFLDNGGMVTGPEFCTYCNGKRDALSSDNPQKAIISLSNVRETSYSTYIAVQNELVGAYNDLRDREAQRLYKVTYSSLLEEYEKPNILNSQKVAFKEKIEHIRNLFPQKISEAEISNQ